jgi:predicted transposase YdaD
MASALTLAGMRLDFDVVQALKGRLRTMNILKDSSFYQVLLREGKEIGEREGEIKGARSLLIHLGRIRFGRLSRATRAAIEAIDNLDRLQHLGEQIRPGCCGEDALAQDK